MRLAATLAIGVLVAGVFQMVFTKDAVLIGLGVVLGAAGALGAARARHASCSAFSHRSRVLTAVMAVTAVVALIACLAPARPAVRLNPVDVTVET